MYVYAYMYIYIDIVYLKNNKKVLKEKKYA